MPERCPKATDGPRSKPTPKQLSKPALTSSERLSSDGTGQKA
eukprot:CAMPEP_0183568394 /NCGR_PEP_ID=MMETSP0371-20130417/117109_1 /TAXON_ID=268820 /ORGANISM="Peridinium aciculiferum, Strain PAER-2" /LENGTH=41 /DNA_ID= /DNA_START= /DNA_END= /DNA_ORIENTATION=